MIQAVQTTTKLNSQFDKYVTSVLGEDFIRRLPRKKGEREKWQIIKLPTNEEYIKLRDQKFTKELGDLVGDAFGEFDSLKDELNDWHDNLPESFQNGDKGSQLQDAISLLDNLSEPTVDDCIKTIGVLYFPLQNANSRSDRRDDAVGMLRACIETLDEIVEGEGKQKHLSEVRESAENLRSELDNAIGDAEGVEFPGMY